jgi:very-short-patch-repair endonuclease
MLFEDWLRRHDGAAHTSEIYAAGFSRHRVSMSIANGRAQRIRRSWIALDDCDQVVVSALRIGGRLTCVSAARRLGLWAPDDDSVHVAVRPEAGRISRPELRLHWSSGPAPVRRHAAVDPLINVLHHTARCLEPAKALAVWESALHEKFIDLDVLQRITWRGDRVNRIAGTVSPLSDSGLETEFVVIMRTIGVSVRQQVVIDGHRVDGLIGERLIVQLDGFAHHAEAAARRRDIEADARLRLRGYTVLRFDFVQVFMQPELVKDIVRAAIAQGLHRAP